MRKVAVCLVLVGCGGELPDEFVEELAPPGTNQPVACNHAGDPMATVAGVTAYCDDPAESGEYQCDQYANRMMSTLNLPPVDDWVNDLACEICDLIPADPILSQDYSVWGPGYRNNAGHKPGAGDLLVFWEPAYGCHHANKGAPGHVAVVTGSDPANLYYVQQNWMVAESVGGSAWAGIPRSAASWNPATSFFGHAGGPGGANFAPKCWVHAECAPGKSCNPGPAANPCRHVSHADNGDYCGTTTQGGFQPVGANPAVVYECFDGQIAREQHCAKGCFIAPPGTPDGCN